MYKTIVWFKDEDKNKYPVEHQTEKPPHFANGFLTLESSTDWIVINADLIAEIHTVK